MTQATSHATNAVILNSPAGNPMAPHFRDPLTVDIELQVLYDLLMGTGELIDRLEAKLHPVVYPAAPLDGRPVSAELVPPVIDRIRGLASSIALYNDRLSGLTDRLAV